MLETMFMSIVSGFLFSLTSLPFNISFVTSYILPTLHSDGNKCTYKLNNQHLYITYTQTHTPELCMKKKNSILIKYSAVLQASNENYNWYYYFDGKAYWERERQRDKGRDREK